MNKHNYAPLEHDYAPLPTPFWQHLRHQRLRLPTPQRLDAAALAASQQLLKEAAVALTRDLRVKRESVWQALDSLVQAGILTRPNLIALLNQQSPRPIHPATLSRWRTRGVLRYADAHQIAPDNAAAILLMRLLLPGEKYGWLPSVLPGDEPDWWCWRQDAPGSDPIACPVPLPADLPAAALLWTSWRGAAWSDDWLPAGSGAVRWSGTPLPADLARWGAEHATADAAPAVAQQLAAGYLA
jgi:hypothetical protein